MSRVGKTLLKKMSGAPGYCDDNRALFAFEGGGSMRITEVVGETCSTSVNVSPEAGRIQCNYGSSRQNLSYFRKVGAGKKVWGAEFTEVGRETCNTSVKSEQVGGVEEQNLRKWEEKSALLP